MLVRYKITLTGPNNRISRTDNRNWRTALLFFIPTTNAQQVQTLLLFYSIRTIQFQNSYYYQVQTLLLGPYIIYQVQTLLLGPYIELLYHIIYNITIRQNYTTVNTNQIFPTYGTQVNFLETF